MGKISIFYFSGTGNTWWAAGKFADQLSNLGFKAERVSIEQPPALLLSKIRNSDIIFLAYPVYGSDRPEPIKDFIRMIPEASSFAKDLPVPFGIICTQMMYSGDGAWLEHWLIEEKGYQIKWAVHIRMPNNISIPGFLFKYTNNYNILGKILDKAEIRLNKLALLILNGKDWRQGTSVFWNLMGLMQRRPYRKILPSYQNSLTIDEERCTACGKCVKLCPSENIRTVNGGFPEFLGKCSLCLRCYNYCPASAVRYNNKSFRPVPPCRNLPYRGPVENFNPAVLKE
ncbi:MAG: EFR1 family ferrodoxin [Spirochaetales bacterium]|nr:EFR1 family ferrodoxin [Spirochaetales bacterium]